MFNNTLLLKCGVLCFAQAGLAHSETCLITTAFISPASFNFCCSDAKMSQGKQGTFETNLSVLLMLGKQDTETFQGWYSAVCCCYGGGKMISSCVIRYFWGKRQVLSSWGSALPTRCQSVAVEEFGPCGEKGSFSSHGRFRKHTGFDTILIFHLNASHFHMDWQISYKPKLPFHTSRQLLEQHVAKRCRLFTIPSYPVCKDQRKSLEAKNTVWSKSLERKYTKTP